MKMLLGIFGLIWKLYIAVVFAATAVVLYPLIRPQLGTTKGQKRAFSIFVFWSWVFRVLCFYGVKKVQHHPLPKAPYIILANHASYLDIFLMYSVLPENPFLFLGKSELLRYPLIRAYFKRMNIPVFRGDRVKAAKSLLRARKEVKKGWSVMIFPEGGIPDGNAPRMIPFKQGAFQLAKSAKVPIVPVTYTNNYKLFSDPTEILGRAHPGVSRVYIHPSISTETIAEMEIAELQRYCFDIINGPIEAEHPSLKH
jgi:1-acyl-sn-glycerol-3-phosphate acyltransferase